MSDYLNYLSKQSIAVLSALLQKEKRVREDVISSSDFLAVRVGEDKINIEDWLIESYSRSDAITNEIKKRLVVSKKEK